MTYRPLSDVMSSTANGTVVPSSYGDQIRDNLVAIYTGWSFYATGATLQATVNATWAPVTMNAASLTGVTSADVSIVSGYVLVSKLGVWSFDVLVPAGGLAIVGGLSVAATQIMTIRTSYFSATGGFTPTVLMNVTAPVYVSAWVFASGNSALSTTVAPHIWGEWRGDA